MTTKHQPATPLPWTQPNRTSMKLHPVDGGGRHGFVVATQKQDAAYITHAANAYPKLVEALRDAILRHQDMKHRLGGEIASSFERANDARIALLRELGEE